MGLYGQRIGTVSLVAADPDEAKKVESQLKVGACIQCNMYLKMRVAPPSDQPTSPRKVKSQSKVGGTIQRKYAVRQELQEESSRRNRSSSAPAATAWVASTAAATAQGSMQPRCH